MPRLKSANFAVTNLTSPINSSVNVFEVDDASAFPDTGPFMILVHDMTPGFAGVREIMEVTTINKELNIFFNVLRGREGTTAVAHSAGARVECVWTAGTHQELECQSNKGQPGGYASLDASGNVPAEQLGNVEGMEEHGNEWHNPDFATQDDFNSHLSDTAPHSATSSATANRIMMRDASGRAKVAAPSASDDIARKDTVDAHANRVDNPHAVTKSQVGLSDVDNMSAFAIRTDISKALRVEVSSSAPSDPVNGQIWYDSTNHKFKGYANGAWV